MDWMIGIVEIGDVGVVVGFLVVGAFNVGFLIVSVERNLINRCSGKQSVVMQIKLLGQKEFQVEFEEGRYYLREGEKFLEKVVIDYVEI